MKIKEVPSKVFQSALNKWMGLSMGIMPRDRDVRSCSYCNYYSSYYNACKNCPLTYGYDHCSKADDRCINGIWKKYIKIIHLGFYDNANSDLVKSDRAMACASDILDFIIDRCVYDSDK
jgi:hypothetical protein